MNIKKFLLFSVLLSSSFADASSCEEQTDAYDVTLTLDELKDQCLDILYDLQELGNTSFSEDDVVTLSDLDDALQFFYALDALHAKLKREHEQPKKKTVHWRSENVVAKTLVYEPTKKEEYDLENDHYAYSNDGEKSYFQTPQEHENAKKERNREKQEEEKEEMDEFYAQWTAGAPDDD